MKKSLAFIIALMMALGCLPQNLLENQAYAKEDENLAVAVLGKELEQTGFLNVGMGEADGANVEMREGEYCWVMNPKLGRSKAFINFSLSEKFKPKEFDGTEYELYIEYYDEGQGFFKIEYDALDDPDKKIDVVTTSNEKQWKSVTYTLTDALFQNRLGGRYDFRLKICDVISVANKTSPVSMVIKKVEIRKKPQQNPILATATTDELGNTFGWEEENKIIHTKLQNITGEPITATVGYKLVGTGGAVIYDKSEEMTFSSKEVKECDVNVGEVTRCDVYDYIVYVKNEKIDSSVRVFGPVIAKTDSDGILNDEFFMQCRPAHRYPDKSNFEEVVMMSKKLNVGGIRTETPWWDVQPSYGQPFEGSWSQFTAETVKKHGLELMSLLTAAGAQTKYNSYPKTESELALFGEYAEEMARGMSALGFNKYEIWNEGNGSSYNWNHEGGGAYGGILYANMFKRASDAIKSVDKTAKVAGPTAAGNLDRPDAGNHFREAMEAGFWENDPVLSLHLYPSSRPEYNWVMSDIERYYESFRSYGADEPEIWQTEFGYTSADPSVGGDVWKQGSYIARAAILHKTEGTGDLMMLHTLQKNGEVPFDREDMFGVVSSYEPGLEVDGKRFVPFYSALIVAAHNYALADAEILERVDTGEDEVMISRFKSNKFNTNLLTIHTYSDKERQVTLNLGVDKVRLLDNVGNETEVYGTNGVFTFMADGSPIYVLGDIESVEVLKENTVLQLNKKDLSVTKGDIIEFVTEKFTDEAYEIKLENIPECLELVSNDGFAGNFAGVKLKNNMELGESCEFTLKVMSGERVIAMEIIKLECTKTITKTIFTEVADPDNLNKWKASFTLKNNSYNKLAEGYIEFKSPEFLADMKKVDFGRIPANCTGLLTVQLPEIVKKSQYLIAYDFVYKDGTRESFTDKIDFTAAPYMEKAPTIDGIHEPGEWNKTGAMYIDSEEQSKRLIGEWGGVDDLSGYVAMQWDEENLYLAAEITDDTYYFGESESMYMYKDDNIQFGIYYGVIKDTTVGQTTTTFHEMGIGEITSGPAAHRWSAQDNTWEKGTCTTADVAIKRVDNKTYYEFKMPWKDIIRPQDEAPKGGETLGFSFMVNDNDGGGREGWLEYASGIGEYKNTALFTYLTLIK